MIPEFEPNGNLPPGVHEASWSEFSARFGTNGHRKRLLSGLEEAVRNLSASGCRTVYIDGSFVTAKELPDDYDGCWDVTGVDPELLDPVLLIFAAGRAAQKSKFLGELFPAQATEQGAATTFLEFFQQDKDTGRSKGIVAIDIGGGLA